MSKRYFINNLDTPIGGEFYKQLVKEDMEEGVHMATYTDNDRLDVPRGFKKILKRYKPKLSRKKLLEECDVYIYDLHNCDESDISYITGIFSNPTLQVDEQKVLILISNVMVWSATPLKEKRIEEIKKDQEETEQQQQDPQDAIQEVEQSKVENLNDSDQKIDSQGEILIIDQPEEIIPLPVVYVPYEESDYKSRIPNEKYQYMKNLEDQVLALQKENLKVIVVCSGLWYGNGENIFREHFKSAWLQDPEELPYLGDGENKIPLIHISDLVKLVIKITETPCEQQYVFGIDNTPDRRQKAIIQGIADGVGSGKVQSVHNTKLIEANSEDYFKLDIDMKPSNLVVGNEDNPVEFEWTCERGIANHTRKVLEEFQQAHKLRPIKLQMVCPSQRNELKFLETAKLISEHYRIPIITISDILKKAQQEFQGEQLDDFLEELPNIQEYLSSKQPHLVDETMKIFYQVVKWRLNQNDCVNRGFILDNYPLLQEECEMIYYPNKIKLRRKKKPKKKEIIVKVKTLVDDDLIESNQVDQNAEDIMKQSVAEIEQQIDPEELPQDELEPEEPVEEEEPEEGGPKPEPFMPESVIMIKSLDKKNAQSYSTSLVDFFTSKNLEVQMLDTKNKDLYEVFENLRLYIERNGRPFNYLQPEGELVSQHNLYYKQMNDKLNQGKNEDKLGNLKKKQTDYEYRLKIAEKQIIYIQENEQELESIKNFPFRNYLMDFVVPVLNEGLVEVSHMLPDDPVEFLSEYLYKKSFEVNKE